MVVSLNTSWLQDGLQRTSCDCFQGMGCVPFVAGIAWGVTGCGSIVAHAGDLVLGTVAVTVVGRGTCDAWGMPHGDCIYCVVCHREVIHSGNDAPHDLVDVELEYEVWEEEIPSMETYHHVWEETGDTPEAVVSESNVVHQTGVQESNDDHAASIYDHHNQMEESMQGVFDGWRRQEVEMEWLGEGVAYCDGAPSPRVVCLSFFLPLPDNIVVVSWTCENLLLTLHLQSGEMMQEGSSEQSHQAGRCGETGVTVMVGSGENVMKMDLVTIEQYGVIQLHEMKSFEYERATSS